MVQPQFEEYIRTNKSRGVDDETIKSQLRQAGWQEGDIVSAFQSGVISSSAQAVSTELVPSKKFKRLGIFFLVFPVIDLLIVGIVFIVSQIFLSGYSVPSSSLAVQSILPYIFGFLAIILIIILLPFIILGIIFLKKKEPSLRMVDERSGKGNLSVIPEEIKGWNWGAAGLSLFWGVFYGAWIVLCGIILAPIPLLGILWYVFIGMKGNEWAWRKNQWESVDHFKKSQEKWKVWGIVFFLLAALSTLSTIAQIVNGLNRG